MSSVAKTAKPAKPSRPDGCPLFAHASGRWAKKVRGRLVYFGPWSDLDGALNRWADEKDDLLAGRRPRAKGDGLTLHELANAFLAEKEALVHSGELRQGTFNEYHRACGQLLACLGKNRLVSDIRPDDFAQVRAFMAKGLGLAELGKRIGVVRSLFKYGIENGKITTAVVFGSGFKKPSLKSLRRERRDAPSKMLEPNELRKLLEAAGVPMRAMILLGLNCGFGNTDISELTSKALDLQAGWCRFPRPKTEVPRKAPLWLETVDAMKAALAERPEPKDPAHAGRVFITSFGLPWVRHQPSKKSPGKWTWTDAVNLEFGKLLKACGLDRPGVSFYSLRHVHRTIADEVRDRPAIDAIMGHAPEADDMGPLYVERIEESRLRAVTDHVRAWLLPAPKRARKGKTLLRLADAG